MSEVHLFHADNYDEIDRLISQVMEPFDLSWSGARVLLKPNILGPFPPERGVTTHPSVVRALVRYLSSRGARVAVGDNPGLEGYGRIKRSAKVSGILDAAEERFLNLGREAVEYPLGQSDLPPVPIARPVVEADYLISLPKFKTHALTVLTGAVKNSYGHIVGARKAQLHAQAPLASDFSRAVVDIFQLRPPDLVLVDGVVAMEGNGPSSPHLRRGATLVASTSALAVDTVLAALMGLEPLRIPTLAAANERGLGPTSLSQLTLHGSLQPIPHFRLPANIARGRLAALFQRLFFRRFATYHPRVQPQICSGCGLCAQSCPLDLIEIHNKKAQIQTKQCITCYCCLEICPEHAIEIQSRFFQRFQRARSPS